MNILVVDDSRSARHNLSMMLEALGHDSVQEAADLESARAILAQSPVDLALIDIRLSDDARNRDGLILVREVVEGTSATAVCVTASREIAQIRTAIRSGAYDYVLKDDLCEDTLEPIVEAVQSRRRLEAEVQVLRARLATDAPLPGIVGTSPAMIRLREMLRRVAVSERPALITGATGAGKEVAVRAVHALGPHPDAPLLDVNCGAFAENLIESELFGHERGAFTGAERRKQGYLGTVGVGTLFLDEIAELPMALQTRLLRVIETGRFRPVGASAQEQSFEGRIVAATHADLADRVDQRSFREDLYYRLNVLHVKIPPLVEHPEDIPALVGHFLRQQRRPLQFTTEALALLQAQPWPGNVRQLRSLIDRLSLFADDDLVTPALVERFTDGDTVSTDDTLQKIARTVLHLPIEGSLLSAMEGALIEEAMTMADHNKSAAARLLNVHRKAVERRLDR